MVGAWICIREDQRVRCAFALNVSRDDSGHASTLHSLRQDASTFYPQPPSAWDARMQTPASRRPCIGHAQSSEFSTSVLLVCYRLHLKRLPTTHSSTPQPQCVTWSVPGRDLTHDPALRGPWAWIRDREGRVGIDATSALRHRRRGAGDKCEAFGKWAKDRSRAAFSAPVQGPPLAAGLLGGRCVCVSISCSFVIYWWKVNMVRSTLAPRSDVRCPD